LLSIRLTRMGAKKRPFYRIIVVEREGKRDGRFVEIVGHFDPIAKGDRVKLDRDRYDYWLGKGAQPSETVRRCARQAAVAQAAQAAQPTA
jgi:small subunit ribosomal protein S16